VMVRRGHQIKVGVLLVGAPSAGLPYHPAY
jgi:hypothetical protein